MVKFDWFESTIILVHHFHGPIKDLWNNYCCLSYCLYLKSLILGSCYYSLSEFRNCHLLIKKIRVHAISKFTQTFYSYFALDRPSDFSVQSILFSKVSLIPTYLLFIRGFWFARGNNFLLVNRNIFLTDDCQSNKCNPDIWISFVINSRWII